MIRHIDGTVQAPKDRPLKWLLKIEMLVGYSLKRIEDAHSLQLLQWEECMTVRVLFHRS